jgi:hypothetical protein
MVVGIGFLLATKHFHPAFRPLKLADRLWSFIAGGLSLAQQAAPNEN